MTARVLVRGAVVVVLTLLAQHTVVDAVRVGGAHPDVTLLLAVAGGYVAGPERGAVFGFAAGIAADLLLPTTFGLSALVWCLLGFAVGVGTRSLVRSSRWLPPLVFAAATAAGLTTYAILGSVLGQPDLVSVYLPPALAVSTPAAAVLALPVLAAVNWALPTPAPGAGPGGATR